MPKLNPIIEKEDDQEEEEPTLPNILNDDDDAKETKENNPNDDELEASNAEEDNQDWVWGSAVQGTVPWVCHVLVGQLPEV